MGYAYYEREGMKRGYGVICKCHKRGCQKQIDRGLSYLCYCCLWYFCADHLTVADVDQSCFAGQSGQVCQRCSTIIDADVEETDAQENTL